MFKTISELTELVGKLLGECNIAMQAASNPFLCSLYLNKICLNQVVSISSSCRDLIDGFWFVE